MPSYIIRMTIRPQQDTSRYIFYARLTKYYSKPNKKPKMQFNQCIIAVTAVNILTWSFVSCSLACRSSVCIRSDASSNAAVNVSRSRREFCSLLSNSAFFSLISRSSSLRLSKLLTWSYVCMWKYKKQKKNKKREKLK